MKKIFLSAILAGMVIGFGGTVFLSVENTVIGSLFFTIGLFVVCTRGLHLFTGKVCYLFDNDAAYAKTLLVIFALICARFFGKLRFREESDAKNEAAKRNQTAENCSERRADAP